jgi:tRNA threonylcarbamoyladenosine biosynthesis protein TsaB
MANKNTALLGIESSGSVCAVGISTGDQLISEIFETGKHIHSEKLAPFVKQSLEKTGLSIPDLDGIVISAGPGSFTGLRIGYSLAKGIAHAANIPIIEIPTLDIIAHNFAGETDTQLLAVIDARRDEIFCAVYLSQNSQTSRLTNYQLISITSLSEIINEKLLILGDFTEDLGAKIENAIPGLATFPDLKNNKYSIYSLHKLGLNKFNKKEFSDLENCEPFYMRKFKGVS